MYAYRVYRVIEKVIMENNFRDGAIQVTQAIRISAPSSGDGYWKCTVQLSYEIFCNSTFGLCNRKER